MTTIPTTQPASQSSSILRDLPYMGVIRVNVEAMTEHGYQHGDPNWANLGQGQPEVGDLPGAPPRVSNIALEPSDHAYGPIEGLMPLREKIADHYNRLYRQGKSSQYTAENVAVASGGRLVLSRLAAAMNTARLGYFAPDYTAYEDMLNTFTRIRPVRIELAAQDGFTIDPASLSERVTRDQLDGLLISNPCNPTGVVVAGDDLAAWVEMSRQKGTTLWMDEFYSHFIYDPSLGNSVSAASHVDDVNQDQVIIVDGLTKCYRYPGWRVGWVVAPKNMIRTLAAAGSFLDGGPGRPIQRAAMEVLEPARADAETQALRDAFILKRDLVVERLSEFGVKFPAMPRSTFYAFGDISSLPAPCNTGIGFMREAFKHRVLTVPGEFFDINPARDSEERSYVESFVRFSYGPSYDVVEAGLTRLGEMLKQL